MEIFLEHYNKYVDELGNDFENFPWENEDAYCAYLAQAYYYVTHSTKLLQYAADRSEGALKECLLHHIEEEKGHELMALNDFKKFGRSIDDYPELPETKLLYSAVYKGIDECGPEAIMGYSFALEGISAQKCGPIADRLIATYGRARSSFIHYHGRLDPDHVEEGFENLKLFTSEEVKSIIHYMEDSALNYASFLSAISNVKLAQAS